MRVFNKSLQKSHKSTVLNVNKTESFLLLRCRYHLSLFHMDHIAANFDFFQLTNLPTHAVIEERVQSQGKSSQLILLLAGPFAASLELSLRAAK